MDARLSPTIKKLRSVYLPTFPPTEVRKQRFWIFQCFTFRLAQCVPKGVVHMFWLGEIRDEINKSARNRLLKVAKKKLWFRLSASYELNPLWLSCCTFFERFLKPL